MFELLRNCEMHHYFFFFLRIQCKLQ